MNETAIIITNSVSLIQTIDPNWLYSSIAQSSAAIVGLMGAFLTTKIISQKSIIKELETKINEDNTRIEYLRDSIKEKQDWVSKIDEEEDFKVVKHFLEYVEDKINLENPPSIEELLKMASESEDENFHNLNKKALENSYNSEYLEYVLTKRKNKKTLFGSRFNFNPSILIDPQIKSLKWQRYRQYSDEIYSTNSEINYLQKIITTRNKELEAARAGLDLKMVWCYLGLFSVIGVFLPLFVLTFDPKTMYDLRFPVIILVFISWVVILKYLWDEISIKKENANLKRDTK